MRIWDSQNKTKGFDQAVLLDSGSLQCYISVALALATGCAISTWTRAPPQNVDGEEVSGVVGSTNLNLTWKLNGNLTKTVLVFFLVIRQPVCDVGLSWAFTKTHNFMAAEGGMIAALYLRPKTPSEKLAAQEADQDALKSMQELKERRALQRRVENAAAREEIRAAQYSPSSSISQQVPDPVDIGKAT